MASVFTIAKKIATNPLFWRIIFRLLRSSSIEKLVYPVIWLCEYARYSGKNWG